MNEAEEGGAHDLAVSMLWWLIVSSLLARWRHNLTTNCLENTVEPCSL